MPYRLSERFDASDLAPGTVLHSAPGQPAFPARLALELFRRARAELGLGQVGLWDPLCGSGYLLTVLGLLERAHLREVLASDASVEAVGLARRNLSLLDPAGLAARARDRSDHAARYDKPHYEEAAAAAHRLRTALSASGGSLPRRVEVADVFDPVALAGTVAGHRLDLVLTDVPYGERVSWQGAPRGTEPLPAMLSTLASVLPPHAGVVVCDRSRRVDVGPHPCRWRLRVGTRSAALLMASDILG